MQNSLIADNSLYGIDATNAGVHTVVKSTVFSGNRRPLLAGPGLVLDNSLNFTPTNMSPNIQTAVFLPEMNMSPHSRSRSIPFPLSCRTTIG